MQFRNNGWLVLFLALFLAGGVLSNAPAQAESPRSVSAIKSRAEFDSLAVTYDPDTPYALPHLLFVIDRKDKNKIYYVNTMRYAFHKDFGNGTYLSLDGGREVCASTPPASAIATRRLSRIERRIHYPFDKSKTAGSLVEPMTPT